MAEAVGGGGGLMGVEDGGRKRIVLISNGATSGSDFSDSGVRLSPTCVISQGIWASQKLCRGSLLDLPELQDPRTLGYLFICGLYSKPIAYC